ncbi:MAG: hypothetical protein ACR2NB_05475, partial [Solirubrobacteraceae bacterium]
LESKSTEELLAETRFRAAERYDAKAAREHYRTAIASARPQERLQLRRMAEASLALAERRPNDLKAAALKLGQTPPSNRQLLALRFMGVVAPGGNAPVWRRVAGVLALLLLVVALLAVGWGVVQLVALPLGGLDAGVSIFYGFLLVAIVLGGLAWRGRRKQAEARAARGQG